MGFAKPIERYLFGNLLTKMHVFMYLKDIIRGERNMNLPTLIILLILMAVVGAIIRKMIRDKKAGKGCSSCGGGCGGCHGATSCHSTSSRH